VPEPAKGEIEVRRKRRSPGFFIVDNELVKVWGAHLGATGIAVWCVLACYADQAGETYPSYDTIVGHLGIARKTLAKTLKDLEALGLLEHQTVTKGRVRRSLYILGDPKETRPPDAGTTPDIPPTQFPGKPRQKVHAVSRETASEPHAVSRETATQFPGKPPRSFQGNRNYIHEERPIQLDPEEGRPAAPTAPSDEDWLAALSEEEPAPKKRRGIPYPLWDRLEVVTASPRGTYNEKHFAVEVKSLEKLGATPELLDAFLAWWLAHDWRGQKGERPTFSQVRQVWGRFMLTLAPSGGPDDPTEAYRRKVEARRAERAKKVG
jgi:hypothetical protein